MPACHLRPKEKREFLSAVGEDLVRTHGKQKYYKTSDVRMSVERSGHSVDVECWAFCFFSTPGDFKAVHDAAGEVCDYVAMKAEVLREISNGAASSLFDVNLSWLEWPDVDLTNVFEWFDFS